MFNRIFHQVELMDRMMDVVGVNPAIAVRVDKGAAWYEARTNCISCCHECECRNWLECSDGLAVPPDFCPNAAFFRRCTEADVGGQLGPRHCRIEQRAERFSASWRTWRESPDRLRNNRRPDPKDRPTG
jgi:hypothetical protein